MQKSLYKLAVSRSFDALTRRLQSDEMVSAETSELYRRFDSIFLKLYPTFIDDFNRLLRDEEKIKLHPGTLLHTRTENLCPDASRNYRQWKDCSISPLFHKHHLQLSHTNAKTRCRQRLF